MKSVAWTVFGSTGSLKLMVKSVGCVLMRLLQNGLLVVTAKPTNSLSVKAFQETYMLPKCGEEVLLSAQPDSRSSPPLACTQKWVQLFGSPGVVDLYPPNIQLPLPSSQTLNQVPVGLL